MRDIRVPEQIRGQGFGQILQRALLEECSKRNITRIYGSTENPHVLLSWLKIPEVRNKLFLTVMNRRIPLKAEALEKVLRDEIQKNNIENTDTHPTATRFFDYVIDISQQDTDK